MSKLTIEVTHDAHDDVYYKVSDDEHRILLDRVNTYKDLIIYLEGKIKSME